MIGAGAAQVVKDASWADCLLAAGVERTCGLISRTALGRVLELGAMLPALSGGGIECHLGEPERADVAIRLSAEDGGLAALLGLHPVLHFPASLAARSEWQRVRRLGERWAQAGTPEHARLQSIWLEFDLPQADAPRVPSIFLGLRDTVSAADLDEKWLAEAAAKLCGEDAPATVRTGLIQSLVLSKPVGQLAFVGLMLSRQAEAVRVVLNGLSARQLCQHAATLGWCGDVDALESALWELGPRDARLALHLDVAAAVGPTLGVEIALPGHPRQSAAWDKLLRGLLACRACTPAAAEAVKDWPGLDAIGSDGWRPPQGTGLRGIVRRINHIKLLFQPMQPMTAKVYLYCGLLT